MVIFRKFHTSENRELMELLQHGPEFYEETQDIVTYTIDQEKLNEDLDREVDFFSDLEIAVQ